MVGSGTTVLEAFLNGRRGIGFDIDWLALLISRVKTAHTDPAKLSYCGLKVLANARMLLATERDKLIELAKRRWDAETREFVDYWFLPQTQIELLALITEIERIDDTSTREFLQLVFSSTIITKSGGVSQAMDLGHTRPHKVSIIPEGSDIKPDAKGKRLRSAILEFEKKLKANLEVVRAVPQPPMHADAQVHYGFSQDLPLRDNSVSLIITSPPYASNAIDYMRAHKFSLVWLGYPISQLAKQKTFYIGNESTKSKSDSLPPFVLRVASEIAEVDEKKSKVLCSYFSEMRSAIAEMYRVLKPGRAAILVVGNSIFRGRNSRTAEGLAEIGKSLGFEVPGINKRDINRDRRMLPVSNKVDLTSMVENRMLEEHVIGFYKPC